MGVLEENLRLGSELQPHVQWAFAEFCRDCFAQGLQFRVSEAYRTQERQNYLYTIGRRGIPGEKPVTWTLHSEHTARLAADCYPINCTHLQLEKIAKKYGIAHPWPDADPPHYSFAAVPAPQPEKTLEQQLAQAEKALKWAKGLRLFAIRNLIGRLRTLLGV